MQTFTLHTHTLGFDGKNSADEMAATAEMAGFEAIGISNHFIVHPNIESARMYKYAKMHGFSNIYSSSFNSVMKKFIVSFAILDKLQDKYNIKILRGMEVDFFNTPKWRRYFELAVNILRPDYIIGSTHFIEYNGALYNMHDVIEFEPDKQMHALYTYWKNVKDAAASGLFTWMAHLDLPKKMGLGREEYWRPMQSEALDAMAKTNTGIEINTSMYRLTCQEPYPSPTILKMVAQKNIPVLISDDAHSKDQIGRHFERAKKLAINNGVKHFMPLDEILKNTTEKRNLLKCRQR